MQSDIPPAPLSPTSPDLLAASADGAQSSSASPELLPSGSISPSLSPHTLDPSTNYQTTELAPSVLPSPALIPTNSPIQSLQHVWPASFSPGGQHQQNFPAYHDAEADVDRQASAALLMLNRDSRGSVASINGLAHTPPDSRDSEYPVDQSIHKRTSMSVRDLLNS